MARVVAAITDEVRPISGLSEARDTAVEKASGFPLLMVYPRAGFWRPGTAAGGRGADNVPMRWGTHAITVAVHVARRDLPFDIQMVMNFADSVPNALLHGYDRDKFAQTVVCLSDPNNRGGTAPITYEFGPGAIGAVDTVALTFSLDVTVEEEIT